MLFMKSEPDTAAPIIRTGTDGRLCFSLQQREAMLDAFEASGRSALAFSKEHGVKYQTFISWLRKRRELAVHDNPSAPVFAEVVMKDAGQPPASTGLRLTLPCGTVMDVTSRAALPLALELLQALRRPC
jgi:hypothetical protein